MTNGFVYLQELARKLQFQENTNLTFEEQDRLVAMEAQDKELARMLQERVSAKLCFIIGLINMGVWNGMLTTK